MSDATAHNHRSDDPRTVIPFGDVQAVYDRAAEFQVVYEAERMLADGPCPLHPFLVWHDRDECVRNWGGTFDPRHSADGEAS